MRRLYLSAPTSDSWTDRVLPDITTGSLPPFKEDFQRYVKARRAVSLSKSSSFQMGFVLIDSPSRLEKMIVDLRSPQAIDVNPDPTTNFWTIYNKVANEYDEGIVSKYVEELDNSLFVVSTFSSRAHTILSQVLSVPGRFVLCCNYCGHCANRPISSTKSLRFDKRSAPSHPAAEHHIQWNKSTGARHKYPQEFIRCSVRPLLRFDPRIARGLLRSGGETVDAALFSTPNVGASLIEGRNATSNSEDSKNGD